MGKNTSGKLSAEERRKKTLKSVAEEFAENGFEGTRMADLAEAADISEAMLVKLYESKENLYSELIKNKIDETPGTPFPDDELDDLSPDQVLLQLAMELVRRCDEDQTFLRLLYYSALEDNELSDMFYEERIQTLQNQLSAYMREQVEEGAFRELDPDQAATGFMGMVSHVLCMKHIFDFPLPTGDDINEELMQTFVDVFLEGVRA